MTLYVNLAELLGTRIEQGFYRPGDRLPSVRALSVEHGVSLSTVQQAYRVLEDSGLATPKPKSGYFVPVGRELPELPAIGRPAQRPVDISQWDQVLELIRAVPRKDVVQLGRGMPDITTPTMKPLLRNLAAHQPSPGHARSVLRQHLRHPRTARADRTPDARFRVPIDRPRPGGDHRLP
ncbi:DNA-binding transcriptional MocR family regulator [Pseudomonas silensiensis]|nr:DNA-binding transcriptional MocR family regulator [Pseudomonas silensiensis]